MAVQTDGKIVAAGYVYTNGQYDFALARYNTDGSLDTSFGTNGKVVTDFGTGGDEALAVVIDADGKIVVAGYTAPTTASTILPWPVTTRTAAWTPASAPDGKVVTDFGTDDDQAYAVAIQADGKIVLAGRAHSEDSHYDFALARYNADGSLDTSFGTGGKVVTDFGTDDDQARGIVIQPDGKIVLAGYTHPGALFGSQYDFALARYNRRTGSTPDNSFGIGGMVVTDFGGRDGPGFVRGHSSGRQDCRCRLHH